MKKEHIIIKVNGKEASEELEKLDERRGRSKTRRRSPSPRNQSSSRSRTRRDIEAANLIVPENVQSSHNSSQRDPEIGDAFGEEVDSTFNGIENEFFDTSETFVLARPKSPLNKGHVSHRLSKVSVLSKVFPLSPDFADDEITRMSPDINVYQHKKTLAQGFMDLALLSANANQLRYVLESKEYHPYFYFSLSFIIISLILQVIVGVGLLLNSKYDVKDKDEIHKADRINNLITAGILLVTIVNVLISAFGVAEIKQA